MDEQLSKELKARCRFTEDELETVMRWYFAAEASGKIQPEDLTLAARIALITNALATKKLHLG